MLPFFVFPSDTTPDAQLKQLEIHRAMSGEQRMMLAYEMSMVGREWNRQRLRREHPEWPEARIALELLRIAFLPAPLPPGLK